jgi:hypothetical protein
MADVGDKTNSVILLEFLVSGRRYTSLHTTAKLLNHYINMVVINAQAGLPDEFAHRLQEEPCRDGSRTLTLHDQNQNYFFLLYHEYQNFRSIYLI